MMTDAQLDSINIQFRIFEVHHNAFGNLRTDIFMPNEMHSRWSNFTSSQFADVVKQSNSTTHQFGLCLGKDCHCMVEYIVLMMHVLRHSNHLMEFGGHVLKQSKFVHLSKCCARVFRYENLVNLVTYTLTRYICKPRGILFDVGLCLRRDIETFLHHETNCAHHTKRVFLENHIGVGRCDKNTILDVLYPVPR